MQGDVVFFDQFLMDLALKRHNLDTDDFRVALTTGGTTPLVTTPDPRFGSGGTTNFAAEEVTPGGNYAADGQSILSTTVGLVGGALHWDGDDVSWAQHANNPTNATWGIIYNFTDTGKRAVGFVDIGGAFDMTTGPLNINWGTPLGSWDQA